MPLPPLRALLARLVSPSPDPQAAVRPLWHRLVGLARAPDWYAVGGIADTVPGRFDAITLVLALVMLRMEASEPLRGACARLTELFVEDMDGQLRQSGVGDLVVGKRVGRLMSVLGGRLDALRAALAEPDDAALVAVIGRNATLGDAGDLAWIAAALRRLAAALAAADDAAVLAGEFAA